MNGFNTPQRAAFYFKYKKSDIFDDELLEDKSQRVTKKVNTMKCAYQFKPHYNDLTPREQYQKEYWNETPKAHEKPSYINKDNLSNKKEDGNNKQITRNHYSTRQKYVQEFMTGDIFGSLPPGEKNRSFKLDRSKSLFQLRSKSSVVLEGDQNNNKKVSNQLQRINFLASNIFNDQNKELIVLNTISTNPNTISDRSTPSSQELIQSATGKKIDKSQLASEYDWLHTNTELSNRTHLKRSQTIEPSKRRQEELIAHFDDKAEEKETLLLRNMTERNWDKTFFLPNNAIKSIDTRPNRNLIQRFPQDKEVDSYEIYTNNNFYNVDCGKIKQMFQTKGLHIFKFEDISNGANGYQSGKLTFCLRKDMNDEETSRRMNEIEQEIKHLGLNLNKVVPDTHIKKERRQTPGHLLKKAKRPMILTQDSMRNMKPQCNIKYKNFVSYQKEKKK